MKVYFRTNLDRYVTKMPYWNNVTTSIPRKGDRISISGADRGYPDSLRVVSVLWTDANIVTCELWYDETEANLLQQAGRDL